MMYWPDEKHNCYWHTCHHLSQSDPGFCVEQVNWGFVQYNVSILNGKTLVCRTSFITSMAPLLTSGWFSGSKLVDIFPFLRTPVWRALTRTTQPVKPVLQAKDTDVCVLLDSRENIARKVRLIPSLVKSYVFFAKFPQHKLITSRSLGITPWILKMVKRWPSRIHHLRFLDLSKIS